MATPETNVDPRGLLLCGVCVRVGPVLNRDKVAVSPGWFEIEVDISREAGGRPVTRRASFYLTDEVGFPTRMAEMVETLGGAQSLVGQAVAVGVAVKAKGNYVNMIAASVEVL